MTKETRDEQSKTLEQSVDTSRREFVAKTVKASAFAVPLALGVETLTARKVYAQSTSAESGAGGGDGEAKSSTAASVPEPATVGLLGLGLASLALQARRRRKQDSGKES